MNLEIIVIGAFVIIILSAILLNNEPEYKGDLNVNVKASDTDDNTVIYKPVITPIDNTEINKAYDESRLEIDCDIILNKVESTEDDVKHIWEERAKRLYC